MRVMFLSSLFGISGGGAGILVDHLARGVSKAGHHVSVITIGGGHLYTESQDAGLRIYRFQPANIYPFEEKDKRPAWQKVFWQLIDLYNIHSARVIRQIIRKESPEIIHVHKMRGFSSSVWSAAHDLLPGRVIQTCHDYESMSPDGILRGTIGRMALQRQWPVRGYQLIRSGLSRKVAIVTAPNAFTLNRIRESGIFPNAKGRVIPNTHGWSQEELVAIHQNSGCNRPNLPRFLYLGRLEPEKGVSQLCEAFLRVFERYPSAILDIAGWGTLDSALRDQYSGHSGFNIIGTVDGEDKAKVFRNADFVILPSLVDEVFPLTVVEAYAFGKPVIVSHKGGLPELVKSGETGWLVKAGDIGDLIEKMKLASEIDPFKLSKMSQNCKEYSYEFAVEKIIREYLDLYGELIE